MEKNTIGALYKSTEIIEKKLLLDILENFGDNFNEKKAKGFNGIFQLSILCDGQIQNHLVIVDKSGLTLKNDMVCENPFLKIECDFEMFCNITLGKFNPIVDVVNGKIKLDRGLLSLVRFAKFGSLLSNREIDLKFPTTIKHPVSWKKPEKILLVNGSPRRSGSTKLMLEWFKEGLPAENTEVLDISSLKIGKCLHCFKCWTNHPNECVIDDDAKIFRQKIDEADLIVFFVPVSYASMPSDMKRALERLMPETTPFFYNHKTWNATAHPVHKHKKPQAFLQFLVWGFPEMKHGNILEENFNEWATHSHKINLGSIKRPGINMILGDPRLQSVRLKIKNATIELASSVYNFGLVLKEKKEIIQKPDYISVKDFQFYATNYWIKRFKTDYWN
jgi:multimeric flavodoxin WrbA